MGRDTEGVVATDRDQGVDVVALEGVERAGDTVVGLQRVRARRAEDRPTAVDEPAACSGP